MQVRHYASFAELVKGLRREHRLSQRALAKTLRVSPGYVGQWELKLSQPSAEVALKLCHCFAIEDVEYVQRLAFASRAPEWLRDSILRYQAEPTRDAPLSPMERRLIALVRRLPREKVEKLVSKVEGWVEAMLDR